MANYSVLQSTEKSEKRLLIRAGAFFMPESR